MKVILMLVAVYALIINQSLKTDEVISSSPSAAPEVNPGDMAHPVNTDNNLIFGVYSENAVSLKEKTPVRDARGLGPTSQGLILSPVYPVRGIKMAAIGAAR